MNTFLCITSPGEPKYLGLFVYVAQDCLYTRPIGLASFWPNNVCVPGSGLYTVCRTGSGQSEYLAQNVCITGPGVGLSEYQSQERLYNWPRTV